MRSMLGGAGGLVLFGSFGVLTWRRRLRAFGDFALPEGGFEGGQAGA